jgi:hypothetical protein
MSPSAQFLILERNFDPGIEIADVTNLARESLWCLEMHRVDWHGSLLSADGLSLVCCFSAADRESIRQALRKAEADMRRLWAGTVHTVENRPEPNVLVERSFASPVELADIQAQEDASQWCLDIRNVRFVSTYFSQDRQRMLCLYSAPDAESVREAQREAGMPVDRIWAFHRIGLEHVTG